MDSDKRKNEENRKPTPEEQNNEFLPVDKVRERQRMLSRFLNEINSGKKPSDEIIQWWLGQY